MMCDNCREQDAVVQVMRIGPEGPVEINLCEKCAAEKGIETNVTMSPKSALAELLLPAQKPLAALAGETGRCPFCSYSLRDFRTTGRLGCARCYESFDGTLRDLLRRVHGSSQHAGKAYVAPETEWTQESTVLSELRRRLRRAVDSEQFELAAELRDQIKVLE